MISGINRGWSVLCGILLYVMDKIRFPSENGEGEKLGIVRSVIKNGPIFSKGLY